MSKLYNNKKTTKIIIHFMDISINKQNIKNENIAVLYLFFDWSSEEKNYMMNWIHEWNGSFHDIIFWMLYGKPQHFSINVRLIFKFGFFISEHSTNDFIEISTSRFIFCHCYNMFSCYEFSSLTQIIYVYLRFCFFFFLIKTLKIQIKRLLIFSPTCKSRSSSYKIVQYKFGEVALNISKILILNM